MLFLIFKLDGDRYAIEVDRVASVLPLVSAKKIPHAPDAVAGLFTYRGDAIPLIDLCQLALGRPARRQLSTRIIVLDYAADDGKPRKLGVIAEQVVETIRRATEDFESCGVSDRNTAYLGPVAADSAGLIQWIRIEQLLPESIREVLFQETESAGGC